ncbi:hypothetical protein CPS_0158 [Colwellia psychrerythraea 34H]|uniref:Uncharacterized protein n=1 Tax=Colwellia psychrerythraea (strain 34H / ATCC BAA-681) TaxID=167879 RepID=Q48AI7_COLP3|nr:hypothetical protein CPS_0158 [Colwellia psychrerythraea 34H]
MVEENGYLEEYCPVLRTTELLMITAHLLLRQNH